MAERTPEGGCGMERVILHCDLNSFFASVELLDYPQLRQQPDTGRSFFH